MKGQWVIESVNTGKPIEIQHGRQTIQTGIYKTPREGAVRLSITGPDGDGQGDLVHHGGTDKAVCVYFGGHYPYWEQEMDKQLEYGAFGENLTLNGAVEGDLVIGDVLEAGGALLQVSQPRQPCFKLGLRHAQPELPLWVQETGKTGFYLRVLCVGEVKAGDSVSLRSRPEHGMTLEEANEIYYLHKNDATAIQRLLDVPELAASWRNTLQTRLEKIIL